MKQFIIFPDTTEMLTIIHEQFRQHTNDTDRQRVIVNTYQTGQILDNCKLIDKIRSKIKFNTIA